MYVYMYVYVCIYIYIENAIWIYKKIQLDNKRILHSLAK